jgi:hypothetical protein
MNYTPVLPNTDGQIKTLIFMRGPWIDFRRSFQVIIIQKLSLSARWLNYHD